MTSTISCHIKGNVKHYLRPDVSGKPVCFFHITKPRGKTTSPPPPSQIRSAFLCHHIISFLEFCTNHAKEWDLKDAKYHSISFFVYICISLYVSIISLHFWMKESVMDVMFYYYYDDYFLW